MNHKKSNPATKVLSVAALFSLQLLPNALHAQVAKEATAKTATRPNLSTNYTIKLSNAKLANQKMSLVGILKGEPLFKNGNNEFFTVDINTGDIKTVSETEYARMAYFEKQHQSIKVATPENSKREGIKGSVTQKGRTALNEIRILGIDADGHVIQETAKGEKFYLDAATGDMIDYVGHMNLKK